MNKRIAGLLMIGMLLAPIKRSEAACVGCAGLSAGATAGITLGAVGAAALIIWGIRHHQKKQRAARGEQQPVVTQKRVKTTKKQKAHHRTQNIHQEVQDQTPTRAERVALADAEA